ncbi:MAG TPA: hypothetical protein VK760_03080 [Candidatus Acidoferrales bacterium]|jgi:hypothetical protein|nr:hypothetical protein [Candidatus Acidoferrales bacterium]
MLYTEWLRVRGALKWIGIVLGVLIVVCGIARVVMLRYDGTSFVRDLQNEPDSKVAVTTLSNGVKRTTIVNDREQVQATIDDRGYDGEHIVVVDRKANSGNSTRMLMGGSVQIQTSSSGNGQVTVLDTGEPLSFGDLTVVGLVIAMIAATILGAPFAKENDGHLEFALTKPIGRTSLTVQTMLVDCAGVIAAFAIGVAFRFVVHIIFQSFKVRMSWEDAGSIAVALLGAIAWYAMLNALTASMKRAYGVVLGLAWPIGGIVLALAGLPPGNVVRDMLRTVAHLLSYIDPLNYLNVFAVTSNQLILLAVLALVYGTLAAIQWRRVEA